MEVGLNMGNGLFVTKNVEEVSNLALVLVVTLPLKEEERDARDPQKKVENAMRMRAMVCLIS